MSIFQKVYDWIDNLGVPAWLQAIFEYLCENIIYPALKELGKDNVDILQRLVVSASKMSELTNQEKAVWVLNEFKRTMDVDVKDRIINLAIELMVNKLKAQGIIK